MGSSTRLRLTAQIAELKAANCQKIFQEKASGAKSDRKQLARLMASLEEGDVVVVTRLDRLARSMLDLLTTLNTITKAGAGFKSLKDTWADTHGDSAGSSDGEYPRQSRGI